MIVFDDGKRSFDCTFRDLSQSGARVQVSKNAQIPEAFYLINIRDRCAYDAKVVRNNGAELGIIFNKVLPLADLTDPKLSFLKRLWLSKATR